MKVVLLKPVEKYIKGQPIADKIKIAAVIKNFRDNGPKSVFYSPLRNGVFELTADTAQHWHRILGMMDKTENPNQAVLTSCFSKTTNTTPKSEIELSQKRMTTYLDNKT